MKPKVIRSGELSITVRRLPQNPIVDYESSPTLGDKINGPSVIRAPDWIKNPLGTYYLYFAHHNGQYIRLAYADAIEGPWTVYEPGTLRLEQAAGFIGHIASPDVHVDQRNQLIRMYFHGSREGENQKTGVAISHDGIVFESSGQILGSAYFRVFSRAGAYYAIDTHGYLNRSLYPDRDWQRGNEPLIAPISINDAFGSRDDVRIRHSTTWIKEDTLFLFYTRKSDAPERILLATIDLKGDWRQWTATEPIEILRPETDYEGVRFPIRPSKSGGGKNVQELRDPFVFTDGSKNYLFYSIAGEMGLALAEIAITWGSGN